MDDKKKTILIAVVAVVAVAGAVFMASKSVGGQKEEVVGTLDMGSQGGKANEQGAPAPGTTPEQPKDINANPSGVGP